ncbi:hypothetical protein AMATHDRAFT_161 [Amanita thiersii Skay4041]|uniref:Uncharacterized protein n=1 Tax=Amanita thiersii Skay4041 TaxID=703135 RepID=A0A2A9NWQ5_9AGAR|nr:hypothetical protein AMATHDRAFT_161 [Amanita thiersii Skay4041]
MSTTEGRPNTGDFGPRDMSFERVMSAIDSLENCDVTTNRECLQTDGITLTAINVLSGYLDTVENTSDCLQGFIVIYKRLVHVLFLARLFQIRTAFKCSGAGTVKIDPQTETNVCLVDAVLARISSLSILVACGSHDEDFGVSIHQQHCLLAAAQLPGRWSSVICVITSHSSSPAAKRIALRLLYAAYVLGGHLIQYDPWEASGLEPGNMGSTCLQMLNHLSMDTNLRDTNHLGSQHPIHWSMLIALYMSLTLLSDAIQYVMTHDLQEVPSPALPFPKLHLDPCQIMLLKWNTVLLRCWLLWDDHRMAGFDCIASTTATWLFHYYDTAITESPGADWSSIPSLLEILGTYPEQTFKIFLQIIHNTMEHLSNDDSQHRELMSQRMTILGRACWVICKISDIGHIVIDQHGAILVSNMLQLFFYFCESDDQESLLVKWMALESFTAVDNETFQYQLSFGLTEVPNQIQRATENAITRLKRALGPGPFLQKDLDFVRTVLNFLMICWHNNFEGCLLRGTASTFLILLIKFATTNAIRNTNCMHFAILKRDLWTTLGIIARHADLVHNLCLEKQRALWDQVVTSRPIDLIATVGFARYMTSTVTTHDVLQCTEAWNLLSGALLMIITGDLRESEAVACLGSPLICAALLHLLASGQRAGM